MLGASEGWIGANDLAAEETWVTAGNQAVYIQGYAWDVDGLYLATQKVRGYPAYKKGDGGRR